MDRSLLTVVPWLLGGAGKGPRPIPSAKNSPVHASAPTRGSCRAHPKPNSFGRKGTEGVCAQSRRAPAVCRGGGRRRGTWGFPGEVGVPADLGLQRAALSKSVLVKPDWVSCCSESGPLPLITGLMFLPPRGGCQGPLPGTPGAGKRHFGWASGAAGRATVLELPLPPGQLWASSQRMRDAAAPGEAVPTAFVCCTGVSSHQSAQSRRCCLGGSISTLFPRDGGHSSARSGGASVALGARREGCPRVPSAEEGCPPASAPLSPATASARRKPKPFLFPRPSRQPL